MKLLIKIAYLFCALFFILQPVAAQFYIDKKKEKIYKEIKAYQAKDSITNTIVQQTDSTIVYLIRDSSVQDYDYTLWFDENKTCFKETNFYTCDSCLQKALVSVLNSKFFRWTKINNNTYFARYPYRIILTVISNNKQYGYICTRSTLDGKTYREIIRNAIKEK